MYEVIYIHYFFNSYNKLCVGVITILKVGTKADSVS